MRARATIPAALAALVLLAAPSPARAGEAGPLDEAAAVELALQAAVDEAARSLVSLQVGEGEEEPSHEPSIDELFRLLPRGASLRGPVSAVLVDDEGTLVTALEHFPRALRPTRAVLADGRSVVAHPRGIDYRLRLAVFVLDPEWKQKPAGEGGAGEEKPGEGDAEATAPPVEVRPIALWDGAAPPRAGTFCAAVGAGYGAPGEPSVSFGIVSARDRMGGRVLQTDARIDRGVTGGALVDIEGRLIGIPVSLDPRTGSNSGVGFAVDVGLLRRFLPRLREGEDLLPSFLGVSLPVADRPDERPGVPVIDVILGTAASTAGLRPGDRIMAVNDVPLTGSRHLRQILGLAPAGTKVVLTVRRPDGDSEIIATLGTRS